MSLINTELSQVKDLSDNLDVCYINLFSENKTEIIRKISIDPTEYPIITWQLKITKIFEKGDVTKKQGDDYPARIYVTFTYDPAKLSFMEKTRYKAARLFYGEYPPQGAIN
ncbi:MAG: hypothetical protein SRB2_04437 [Desulfobacteraceae bacterium Eth-SRB2]|nr:MAG: hypothetical protein SRB2_04437 [Desulfobacteraceae bacterium Eth-SRB2]